MFKKKHLQAMEREQLESTFLEIQDVLEKALTEKQQEYNDKRKILMIAKPFFEAFDNMDLSRAKEMGKIAIGFLVTDIYKIVNEDEDDKGFSLASIFSAKEPVEKKDKDYKQVVIKIAEKLAENGIMIPVSEPLKTTEANLIFIKNQILKV